MILVLDVKLDSIEFSVYQLNSSSQIAFGVVENIGYGDSRITTNVRLDGRSEKHVEIIKMVDHFFGMKKIIEMLQEESIEVLHDPRDISIVAHRVAHGGDYFHAPVVIDKEVKRRIKRLIPFAPHNQKSLKCIDISQKILSNSAHIAVFDTAFHQTMPSCL